MVFVPVRRRLSPSLTDGRTAGAVAASFRPAAAQGLRVGRRISNCSTAAKNLSLSLSLSLSLVHLGFLPFVSGSRYLSPAIQGSLLVPRNIEISESFSSSLCFCSEILARRKNQREREREFHTQISNRAFEVNTEIAGSVSEL